MQQQAIPQDAPPAQPAVDPEAEASATPEVTAIPPEEVSAATEPPEPVYEEQTPRAAAETVWVPGYWHPEGATWTWYVGGWRAPPPGHVYAEPHYERVGSRVVYVRGYWRPAAVAPRPYGATRIVFVKPVRPADYTTSYHRTIRGISGPPAGARLDARYQPTPIAHAPRAPQHAAQAPIARVSPERVGAGRARPPEAVAVGTTTTTTSATRAPRAQQPGPGSPPPPSPQHVAAAPPPPPVAAAPPPARVNAPPPPAAAPPTTKKKR